MKKVIKSRLYKAARKTILYFDDGTKEVRFWDTLDEFCNKQGI